MSPADSEKVNEHGQAVAEEVDLRPIVVDPPYRNLGDAQAEPFREKEQLGVEAPAVDRLALEDRPGRVPAEELEPALGVVDPGQGEGLNDEIE